MDGSDHYRKAEELAAKAEEYLGQGDGQESAAVWAAVAQVHATLALAAATELNSPGRQQAVTAAFEPSSSTEDAPIFLQLLLDGNRAKSLLLL
jgi:hypothetical protein